MHRESPNTMTEKVYPSAFNHGVLTCTIDGQKKLTTLYFENTSDTWFLQLDLTPPVFADGGSQFRVDYLEPADGGHPILTVCDVMRLTGRDLSSLPPIDRWKKARDALFGEQETLHAGDFRLMQPRLRDARDMVAVMTFDIHNHPGVCIGAAFLNDTYNRHGGPGEGDFVVRKSRYPDVYELFTDGVQPVPGNNVAYVPTLEMSQQLRALFSGRNSVTLPCTFLEQRQKWVPSIKSSGESQG